jgi:homoserine kinase
MPDSASTSHSDQAGAHLLRSTAVEVQVPATSANLGPGFDTLGLALGLYDHVIAVVTDDPGIRVDIEGEGAHNLPRNESHLVARAAAEAFTAMGVATPGLLIRCQNSIPQGRGLGSSAAAIVAGLVLARGLVDDTTLGVTPDDILDIATRMEGHPDNVAAAIFGGFTTSWIETPGAEDLHARAISREIHHGIVPVVAIPDHPVPTASARGMLADTVSRADAVFNIGRTAALSHALCTDPQLLLAATEDRLHQDARAQAYPASHALMRTLREQGIAAMISGAGPTVLILLADDSPGADPAHDGTIAAIADAAGAQWLVQRLPVDTQGVQVRRRPLGAGH